MAKTPVPCLVVGGKTDTVSKYAGLLKETGIKDLNIIQLCPQKLTGFIDNLKRYSFYKPCAIILADAFSHAEPPIPLLQVLAELKRDKSLGLRIFVVRASGMGDFEPKDLIKVGVQGVYYGAGINVSDFKDWIKRVWDKVETSVHREPATKRTKRSDLSAEVKELFGDSLGSEEGELGELSSRGEVSRAKVLPPAVAPVVIHDTRPPEKVDRPIWKHPAVSLPVVSLPVTLSKPLPGLVNVAKAVASLPTSTVVVKKANGEVKTSVQSFTEIKSTPMGGNTMSQDAMKTVPVETGTIFMKAFAAAIIAFGTSMEQQLNQQQSVVVMASSATAPAEVEQKPATGPVVAPEETPAKPEALSIVEILNKKHALVTWGSLKIKTAINRAKFLHLLIEANGATVYGPDAMKYCGINNGTQMSQLIYNLRQDMNKVKKGLGELIVTERGQAWRLQPLVK